MQAATRISEDVRVASLFQSPQPMQAATPSSKRGLRPRPISIPAAYAGCDFWFNDCHTIESLFQSPQPMQAATGKVPGKAVPKHISIPAAYAGCDNPGAPGSQRVAEFQSPQPMQAATADCTSSSGSAEFQSPQPMQAATRLPDTDGKIRQFQSPQPMQAATSNQRRKRRPRRISIPAAYAGCDSAGRQSATRTPYFNPRSLCRLRRQHGGDARPVVLFQSPQPMQAATRALPLPLSVQFYFNPRSLCRLRRASRQTR